MTQTMLNKKLVLLLLLSIRRSSCDSSTASTDEASSPVLAMPRPEDRFVSSEFIANCEQYHRHQRKSGNFRVCEAGERERLERIAMQPMKMTNYTETGFVRVHVAEEEAFQDLVKYWEDDVVQIKDEIWSLSGTYLNYWDTQTSMKNIEDAVQYVDHSNDLKSRLSDMVQQAVEDWIGSDVLPCSMYGIRIYSNGAMIPPYVDQSPLVLTAILNVDQQIDEEWPLEIVDHEGNELNILMNPGDMLIYEGQSIRHGRPYPMKGNYVANVYFHFVPSSASRADFNEGNMLPKMNSNDLAKLYEKIYRSRPLSKNKNDGDDELDNGPHNSLPLFITNEHSERRWRGTQIKERPPKSKIVALPNDPDLESDLAVGSTLAHKYANEGLFEKLEDLLIFDPEKVHALDDNGWSPLHEAVRSGSLKVVKLLVEKGSDINKRTHKGRGGTPLWWAEQSLQDNHSIIKYLKKLGAINLGPGD